MINMASLKSNSMTDEIFGMFASVKKNHHVASDELEGIFNTNAIHCKEAKHYTFDDSEWSKKLGQLHKSCNYAHQVPRHPKKSALFTKSMVLGWIIFFTIKHYTVMSK